MSGESAGKPEYVEQLENVFGPPSSEGFGSAVFSETIEEGRDLEAVALDVYRRFTGDLWERWGEAAWMGPWSQVLGRAVDGRRNVVSELRGIEDAGARSSVGMMLETGGDPIAVSRALASAFDDPAVTRLQAFTIGDGEAMSGLLVAGERESRSEGIFLIFLLD